MAVTAVAACSSGDAENTPRGGTAGSTATNTGGASTDTSTAGSDPVGGHGAGGGSLDSCDLITGPLFTRFPVDRNTELLGIVPLGTINPPSFVLPTIRIDVLLQQPGPDPVAVDLFLPGNARLTDVDRQQVFDAVSGDYHFSQFALYFSPCTEYKYFFNGISALSDELFALLTDPTSTQEFVVGNDKIINSTYTLSHPMAAGTKIGTISSEWPGFVWGANDQRASNQVPLANLSQVLDEQNSGYRHRVCPIDEFADPIANNLPFGNYDGSSFVFMNPANCGTPFQDVLGTLKGVWFRADDVDQIEVGTGTTPMAFVDHSTVPTKQVVSVGTSLPPAQSHFVSFTPQDSDLTSRRFEQVTPDGNTYCYDLDPYWGAQSLLLRLAHPGVLWAQVLPTQPCTGSETLDPVQAVTFVRLEN